MYNFEKSQMIETEIKRLEVKERKVQSNILSENVRNQLYIPFNQEVV